MEEFDFSEEAPPRMTSNLSARSRGSEFAITCMTELQEATSSGEERSQPRRRAHYLKAGIRPTMPRCEICRANIKRKMLLLHRKQGQKKVDCGPERIPFSVHHTG